MPNSERGLYEPTDDGRVFDAAEDEEDSEGSRLPLLIVLALLVLTAFGGVVWLAYKQGQAIGRGEPRILVAETGPAKVAPTEEQSGQVPNQGLKIYEQPAPSDEGAEPAVAAPVAAAAPTAPAELAKVEAGAPVPSQTAPAVTTPKPAVVATAPKPAPVQAVPLPAVAPPKPATPPATVASAPPKPLTAPAAASGSGAYMLQIGSFKSQADASAAWKTYQGKHAALLSGYGPDVQSVDLGEKGTWYRLRIGSFGDREVATALCDRLKASGSSCILAAR